MWKVIEGARGYDIFDENGPVYHTVVRGPSAEAAAKRVVDLLNAAEAGPSTVPPPAEPDVDKAEEVAPGLFASKPGKVTKKKTSKK